MQYDECNSSSISFAHSYVKNDLQGRARGLLFVQSFTMTVHYCAGFSHACPQWVIDKCLMDEGRHIDE